MLTEQAALQVGLGIAAPQAGEIERIGILESGHSAGAVSFRPLLMWDVRPHTLATKPHTLRYSAQHV